MKDEKNLHELPDDTLENISGGKLEAEYKSYSDYYNKILGQYTMEKISKETLHKLADNLEAYYGYVSQLVKTGKYTETILFDENVDWVDKYYTLTKRRRPDRF